ncbi:MAG: amidase [Steroidobacteraceae bacterium]|jgi:amidase
MAAPPIADAFVARFIVEPASSGPLRGTTFAVKDIIDVADRPTGCGNPSWRATHGPARRTAWVVLRLLAAGARLVGKTRTDELAYSLDGRNFYEGAPLNPAAPSRLTGGSSSGAASAVAAGEVDFAIATDTAGSVRVPAAWCGLIGLRPTHARVCVDGVAPLAPSFDTVGWLARSGSLMRDVGAVLLGNFASAEVPAAVAADPRLDALGGAALPGGLAEAAGRFAEYGAPRREIDLGIDLARAAECLRILQSREVWNTHGPWIESVNPQFGPGVMQRFTAARLITDDQVRQAERDRAAVIAQLDAALPGGTMLCLPSVPGPAAARDASAEDLQLQRARLFPLTALASLSGRPQISLPLRTVDAAPVGVSLLGWRNGDEALLQAAARVLT